MADNMKRIGFGQVEPNMLQFQRTGAMFAQLPADPDITQLENGQFAKYDYQNHTNYQNGQVDFSQDEKAGEWLLVYNEIKLYDDFWRESYKDFAMQKKNYTNGGDITHEGYGPFQGVMYPRLCKTYVGDIMTTNCLAGAGTQGAQTDLGGDEEAFKAGTVLKLNDKGFLALDGTIDDMEWVVVKTYTMPDNQFAVKVMRIK